MMYGAFNRLKRHPWIANALGASVGYKALGGNLFAQIIAATSAADYLDERAERRKQECMGVARDAAMVDYAAHSDEAKAKQAAIDAGRDCMSCGPHVPDIAAMPLAKSVVFIVFVVLGATVTAFLMGGHHG